MRTLLWHKYLKGNDFQRLIEGHIWVQGIWETEENTAGPLHQLNPLSFKTQHRQLFLLEAYPTFFPSQSGSVAGLTSQNVCLCPQICTGRWKHQSPGGDLHPDAHQQRQLTVSNLITLFLHYPLQNCSLTPHFGKGHHHLYRLMDTSGKIWHFCKKKKNELQNC